jgi:hypothetical protein
LIKEGNQDIRRSANEKTKQAAAQMGGCFILGNFVKWKE